MLLLLDADFIASAGLHEFLTRDDKAADLMEDLAVNRKVIVLPAFETEASLGVEGGGDMALKAQASAHAPRHPLTCMLWWSISARFHRPMACVLSRSI